MKARKIAVYFISIISVFAVIYTIVRFSEELQELITSRTNKTVEQALTFFNSHPTEFIPNSSQAFLSLFTEEYRDACFYLPLLETVLHGESDYEGFDKERSGHYLYRLRNYIISWKLKKEQNHNGTYVIYVNGKTANLEGRNGTTGEPVYTFHQVPEKVRFILEKRNGKWLIKDSYNFFVFLALQDSVTNGKSDMEKYKLLKDLSNEAEVHINDLTIVENVGAYFICKLNGTLINKSHIPIYYAAIRINFKGMNEYSRNTYHYAPINEVFQPRERKNFTLEENVYYPSSKKYYSFSSSLEELSYKYSYRLILK